MPASNGVKILLLNKSGLGFLKITYKYHDLKLNHKLSSVNIGYHNANYVVPNGDITSMMDNLAMAATEE